MSKKFEPTAQQRENVEAMIGFGVTQAEVARLIKNRETGEPIDEKTLRQHFAAEIDTGQTKANAQVGRFIYSSITGAAGGITDERARAQLAMFWMKMRAGWKDTSVLEHTGKDGAPIKTEHAFNIISTALDKIAARLNGDAAGDDPEAGEGKDPPEA